QRPGGSVGLRNDAAVVHEWQRNQHPPEQKAVHVHEREHALDPSIAPSGEIYRPVAERPLEHASPAPFVVTGGERTATNKSVPGDRVHVGHNRDFWLWRRCRMRLLGGDLDPHHPCAAKGKAVWYCSRFAVAAGSRFRIEATESNRKSSSKCFR